LLNKRSEVRKSLRPCYHQDPVGPRVGKQLGLAAQQPGSAPPAAPVEVC
jgi:hypothetical protein